MSSNFYLDEIERQLVSADPVTRNLATAKISALKRDPDTRVPGVKIAYLTDDGEPQAIDYLIDKLLPTASCCVLGAEEKTGKTFLALTLAIALASKQGLLTFPANARKKTTLIVSPEGKSGLHRRLWGICHALGVCPIDVGLRMPIFDQRLTLTQMASMDALRAAIDQYQPDLLVLDPLISFLPEGTSENDSGMVQHVLNDVRALIDDSKLSILVTHHLSKSDAKTSPFRALRGSSAIGAWLDTLISLSRTDDEFDSVRKMSVWHRDDGSPAPCHYSMIFEQIDSKAYNSISLRVCADPKADTIGASTTYALVRNRDGELTVKTLGDTLGLSKTATWACVKELIHQNKIRFNDEGKLCDIGDGFGLRTYA